MRECCDIIHMNCALGLLNVFFFFEWNTYNGRKSLDTKRKGSKTMNLTI